MESTEDLRVEIPSVAELARPVRGHIVELDSLRGVAALIVVFDHFRRFWLETGHPGLVERLDHYKLGFLVNGVGSVLMFFVLSGFVLTLPALRGKQAGYAAYAIKRVCRIYLPYLAALILSVLACWGFYGREMYGPEFHLMWRSAPDVGTVVEHLLFLGRYNVFAYDPPTWSLVHEMRISLVFPLLCLAALRLRAWQACGLAVGLAVAADLMRMRMPAGPEHGLPGSVMTSWLDSLGYCGIFLLGSLLARYEATLRGWLERRSAVVRLVVLGVAYECLEGASKLHLPGMLTKFVGGVGASGILMLALVHGGWLSNVLRTRPLQFLGRVSYSFYLIHMPILLVLSILLYERVAYGWLLLPVLGLSLVAAAVMYEYVEVPSMQIGRWLAGRYGAVGGR